MPNLAFKHCAFGVSGTRRSAITGSLVAMILVTSPAQTLTAHAQTFVKAPPPTSDARDPISLPGDNLPPPLDAVIHAPPPGTAAPHNEDATLPLSPTQAQAMSAAQAAFAECHAHGYQVGVAVANALGVIVLGMQDDQAHPGRIYNAMRKNLTAIAFGTPSSAVRDKLRAGDFATLARTRPNMTLFPGAIPLFSRGHLVGAIAVSGAPGGELDEACAVAGAAAFSAQQS